MPNFKMYVRIMKNLNSNLYPMECKKDSNCQSCPCTYEGCPRKGICCDCLKYHLSQKQLPACCFSKDTEATYDRSFEKFIKENS